MAIPKPEPRDWIRANAQELAVTDREVLAMLRDASKAVNKELADLVARDSPLISAGVRRAQLEQTRSRLLAKQGEIFERLGDIISARRAHAAARSARLSAAADASLLAVVGKVAEAQFLYDSALHTSQRAIDTALARMKLSALPLSRRIYQSHLWMNGRLGKLINETLAVGVNVKTFAKRARDWFNPNTPGGVRFAAMRLARTEINNAFHAMSAQKYAETPWITKVEWNLSGSHSKPDECNPLADASPYESDETPARPHPQCMCYITPVSVDEDEFVENFLKGDYDEYLDAELEAKGWDVKEKQPKAGLSGDLPKTQASTLAAIKRLGKVPSGVQTAGVNLNSIGPLRKKGLVAYAVIDGVTYVVPTGADPAVPPTKTFTQRLKDAAKDLEALAAPRFGLERRPRPAEFSPEMAQAVNRYTGIRYEEINKFLRGQMDAGDASDRLPGWISGLDAALGASVLDREVVVYRGMANASTLFGDRLENDLTGLEWLEQAYVSTSALERRTQAFLTGPKGKVLLRILVPKGVGAIEASPENAEAEILLRRGLKMRVVKDNGIDDDGVRRLDVEVF